MANPLNLAMYIAGGGVVGYLYYRLIGCSAGGNTGAAANAAEPGVLPGAAKDGIRVPGACAITSRPVPAIIYGAVMGAMLGWR
ncbi:MAG: hypothetical protein OHK0011_15640 [Turneriella sp.]